MQKNFYLPAVLRFFCFSAGIIASILFSPHQSIAQKYVNSGTHLVIPSGSKLVVAGDFVNDVSGGTDGTIENNGTIEVAGDWTNNAPSGVFTTNAGTVDLNGAAQTIDGSEITLFNNLTLSGTGNKTAAVNITVGGGYASPGGVLTLDDKTLILDSYDLTMTNPLSTGITRASSVSPFSGFICSETSPTSGYSYVRWNIAQNTGTYEIPFVTAGGTDVTFLYDITGAGTGTSGYALFATYPTAAWDNTPYPTGVPALLNDGLVDNSDRVIDRFYLVEHYSYTTSTTRPTGDYTFKYDDLNHSAAGNSITEANLTAQRYNSDLNKWGDWLYGPTVSVSPNTITLGIANPDDFYDIWTLVDNSEPLPIELVKFEGVCYGGEVLLEWITASETNNMEFTIERSFDGQNFVPIISVPGAGTSNIPIEYSAIDDDPYPGTSYYRLKQTDYDDKFEYSDIIVSVFCEGSDIFDFVNAFGSAPSEVTIHFTADENELYDIRIVDMIGKIIVRNTDRSFEGMNEVKLNVPGISTGIYLVSLQNEFKAFSKRVMLH